ncbi:MAG: universal stress protein [Rhodococcus sp. (in: high G+C Gram-positive bacteria)]|uniref:universal stress protein n=1 Tax=Rhodococcus sp. TaxID=1831 RepID=UPI003BB022A8
MTSDSTSDRRIVVGVDGSESSIDALRWAARLAGPLGADIEAVAAWEFPTYYGLAAVPADYRPDVDAAQILTDSLTSAFGDTAPAGLHESVREGHPARVLVEASRGAEMLIVGSRGHGGFTGLLLGSVSSHCAEHAACPVLVVHPKSPENDA